VRQRKDDPNDWQEVTRGSGPDAIVGHSADTGEPLTKREVFPEGSSMLETDLASQPNHRGHLEGEANPEAAPEPLTPAEASYRENLRIEERLREPDSYEPASKELDGWHEAGPVYDPTLVPDFGESTDKK
jgi:hypothetical protein